MRESKEPEVIVSTSEMEPSTEAEESDVEAVLAEMDRDLAELDELNNRRAAYLEKMALSSGFSAESIKREKEKEAAAILKCQNLLKKSKEVKVKSGKKQEVKDDQALPW